MHSFDVVIIGAGAAGLFCAGVAGQLGLNVLVLDHSEKVAEKIRIFAALPCRVIRRKTSLNCCKSTKSLFMKSTKASCFATARLKTSSTCYWLNVPPAVSSAGSLAV